MQLRKYWNDYKRASAPIRTFFWTAVLFSLILILSVLLPYARLYYARTQIPPPEAQTAPLKVIH